MHQGEAVGLPETLFIATAQECASESEHQLGDDSSSSWLGTATRELVQSTSELSELARFENTRNVEPHFVGVTS